MEALADYDSDEDKKDAGPSTLTKKGDRPKSVTTVAIKAAPEVGGVENIAEKHMVHNASKSVAYNPTYEQLWAPEAGPQNPYYRDGITPGMRNHLGSSMERTNLADFHFEEQFQTFNTFGFAMDPSAQATGDDGRGIVGDRQMFHEMKGRSVHSATQRDAKKRKLDDLAAEKVLAGKGTELTAEEAEDVAKDLEAAQEVEAAAKEAKEESKKKSTDIPETTTMFHGKKEVDYQGRTWVDAPPDLKPADVQSYIPKAHVHTWTGHTKGVHAIRWFPNSGHLLLSCSMDCKIKIWDVYNSRKCMRTYMGHSKPVRDVNFTEDGRHFASAGYDKIVRYWDTETGQCIMGWQGKGIPYCVRVHPKEGCVLAGCSNKNLVQWDPRQSSSEVVQEYVQHLGSVNTVTFIDNYRRIVTTADDKKLFLWEYGMGTAPMKHIAEPWMHSMPSVTAAPIDDGNPKNLLCQSLDNQILVYACGDRFKLNKKKHFVGHTIAGYACQIGVSRDNKYVMSGDGDGRLWLWDWKSCKVYRKIKAHDGVCIGAIWHPVEQSKIATCGWDGLIKFWD